MDPQATKQQMVTSLRQASKAITDTADKLGSLPPPTFDHGEEAAKASVAQMKESAKQMKKAADQLDAATVTDMASLGQVMSGLDAFGDESNIDFDEYVTDDDTQDAIMQLPACQD